MASRLNFQQKITALKSKNIDPSKCTQRTSLYEQILKNPKSTIDKQNRKFNLGNGQLFTDPILAADQLLLREYADSALFDTNRHDPIYIPPVFQSHQYAKKDSTVHLLNYDVDINTLKKCLDNLKKDSPAFWFTGELQAFYDLQLNNSGGNEINAKEFYNWIFNVQIIYLLREEIANQPIQSYFRMLFLSLSNFFFRQPITTDLTLPSTTEDNNKFIQACIQELASKSPGSKLEQTLKKTLRDAKKAVKNLVEQNQPSHHTIKWLFGLVLSELGEKGEHLFFSKLDSLKDDPVLEDTVILSSINFLTNVQKKMHQEIDVLIFSWTRKLIIGVEIKRTLTGKAFDQLDKYHKLIEEKLSDQLGHGWTYHPVICVERDDLFFNNQHYIDQETDLKCWLSTVLAKYPTVPSLIPALNKVKDLLRIVVFAIHASKTAPITTSNWVEYISQAIDTVCTTDNILFYSQRQLPIMKTATSEFNKILFYAPYGCGKSFILQEKAKQLSGMTEYKGRVMYVIEKTDDLETLLEWRLKDELGNEHGVDVYGYRCYFGYEEENKEETEKLMKRIRTRNINALFIDECDISDNQLKEMITKVKQDVDVIWIASNGYGHREILSSYEVLSMYDDFMKYELDVNLRNCKSIVKEALSFEEREGSTYKEGLVLPPPNHPNGKQPYHSDSFENGITEMRKITNDGVLVISDILYEKDDLQTLDKMKLKWKRYGQDENDFNGGESPYQHLVDKNILLINDYELISGFEWNNIILIIKRIRGVVAHHPSNRIMRCTTNLMIVEQRRIFFR
ncbi:uncharacterized protein [Clytia hemisphaerica]|uniref:Uncharacterized protein n=1 Tax=Clytia hemisphaerica TaxID=252671 RepID=A0A7M5WW96_9CNID|eukprot:TCONS_00005748-protein